MARCKTTLPVVALTSFGCEMEAIGIALHEAFDRRHFDYRISAP